MIHVKLTQNVGSWLTGTELGFIDLTHADAVLGAGTYVQTYPVTPPTQAQLDAAAAAAITYNKAHRYILGSEFDPLVPGSGQVIVGGSDGTAKQVGAPLARGNRVVALGDSLTYRDSDLPNGILGVMSYFTMACLLSKGRITYVYNAGVAGNTTAMMLARLQSDVIAKAPDVCLILAGTNDVGAQPAIPFSTTQANITSIVHQLRDAGIQPVICTVTPRNDTYTNGIPPLNLWLTRFARQERLHLLDLYSVLVDPATGQSISGVYSDALHPNEAGGSLLGQYVATNLAPLLPFNTPYISRAKGDPVNLVPNGVFLGDANSDGTADTWTLGGGTGTNTPSLVSGGTDVAGNWQQLATTVAGLRTFFSPNLTGWSVGDTLAFSGVVTKDGNATGHKVNPSLAFTGGTPSTMQPAKNLLADITTPGRWYMEAVVPAGTTAVQVQLATTAGTGTVKWGQITVVNLTAQGLA